MSEEIAKYRTDRDAMGHELYAFFLDPESEGVEIIEREDGYIDASPHVGYYFSSYSDWNPMEQNLLARAVPGRVLDLGCGAGRIALYFQEQGHEVVGIDNSPLAIEICKQRGVCNARLMSITQVGSELGTFSNIVMAGNNWGLMGNHSRARWLLRRFYRMTTPDARMLIESNDVYKTDSPIHLNYQAWNRERGRMSGQIRMRVRYNQYASEWFDYLMVSKPELEEMLSGTGWRVQEYFDVEGASYYGATLVKE